VGEVLQFERKSPKERGQGRTLCRRGFHKWSTDKTRRFDVKAGKLVTVRRCERCGAERVDLT
jgi:hypothetical protein